jgi:hypothetical protein
MTKLNEIKRQNLNEKQIEKFQKLRKNTSKKFNM